jgi:hypothetical protein
MLPTPTLSSALVQVLDHERTYVPEHRHPHHPRPRLRALRFRRTAARRAAAACC